jgi:acyl-CoA thioester hydrolase
MMGHAYYANYLYWFEQARGAFCRARGFAYLELENLGFKLPVVEVHANYRAEVLYDDLIQVKVWISEIKRASVRFDYEIFNVTRQLITTTGYTLHVLIGPERRAISWPQEIKAWLLREPQKLAIPGC